MKIVWDGPKRLINLKNRALDFADLDLWFFEAALIIGSRDGRFKATGLFSGHIVTGNLQATGNTRDFDNLHASIESSGKESL